MMTDKEIIEALVEKFEDEVCGACSYANTACELEENGYHTEAHKMLEMARTEKGHAEELYEMIKDRMTTHIGKANIAVQ